MKRAVLAIVSTVTGLVMLLSFKTHSPSAVATPPAALSSSNGNKAAAGSGTAGNTSTAKKKHASSSTSSSSSAAKSYTGATAMTRFGPVQVQVTVKSGHVTGARATVYPMNSPRDAQINSYAIPALNSEAASAGSANIDMISGATFTSQGYIASLQSALDQAGL